MGMGVRFLPTPKTSKISPPPTGKNLDPPLAEAEARQNFGPQGQENLLPEAAWGGALGGSWGPLGALGGT